MTFSPLTKRTIPHNNKYTSRRGMAIVRVNLHHWAGTNGGLERMEDPKADVSTNYLVMDNGDIIGQVPEEYRAWTSGSWNADAPAITIETQNSSRHVENGNDSDPKSWPVSPAAYKSVIALLADIAKRKKWGTVGQSNLRGHREFTSTSCPGGYLWHRLPDIRNQAKAMLEGKIPAPKPPAKAPAKKPTAPAGKPKPASGGVSPGGISPIRGPGWDLGIPSKRLQKRIQVALKARGRYDGPNDGEWGPKTIEGIQITIGNVGYTGGVDGEPGPNTCKYVQIYAKRFGDYTYLIDSKPGLFSWSNFALGLERRP